MLSEKLRGLHEWFEQERLNPGSMGDRGALQFGRCLAACVTQAKNLERARVSEQVLTEDHLKDPAIAQFPVVARPHPKHGGDAA